MCVEKNERADDSRTKSWVQNVLGAMVFASISTVASGYLILRDTTREHALHIETIIKSLDRSIIEIDKIKQWQFDTERDRFRKEDGIAMYKRLADIEKEQKQHNSEARKYIERITRNTPIILENQRKAHSHDRN